MAVSALAATLAVGVAGISPVTAADAASAVSAEDSGESKKKANRSAVSEAAASEAAAETGKRVEVATLRDERSQTFANPDGTFTAKEFAQPVRTRRNGKWVDIDTTLVKQPGGRLAPRAASAAMSLSGGGDKVFATLVRDGKTMSIAWPGELPTPVVERDTATYGSVLPGVDLVVRAQADGFSHVLVVKSAEAAANPKLTSISMPVRTEGVSVSEDDGGGLAVKDEASGGTVFEAPQPVMWDAGGAVPHGTEHPVQAGPGPPEGAKVADVGLSVRRGAMVLKPDTGLLRGEHTRYPVFIDPVTKTATRTSWTWVSSANPGLEGWKFPNSDDGIESGKGVGRCPADFSVRCTGSNDVQRQYYAMPTASYEGKTILEAEFAITLVHTYNSEARSVQLHRMNNSGGSAISSRTNWSNRPSSKDHITSESPTNPAGSCTATNQNVRFNVASTLKKSASSGWDTTTFGLQAASEDSYGSWKRFCNNAALEVKYNRPPYQPKLSELDMDPGGKCTVGQATKHYTKKLPVLSAKIWDPDHGDTGGSEKLKAQFEVFWTGSDGREVSYTVTTHALSSGTVKGRDSGMAEFEYTVGTDITGDGTGEFTPPQNTVIGWWVRGSDGEAWGPWSHEGSGHRCEFIYDKTKPEAPTVTSSEYPNDGLWHPGVGDYGTFSLYSPGTDVARYRYEFAGEGEKTVVPDEPGRPALVRWMPTSARTTTLYVEAVDTAGNSRQITRSYRFRVDLGRAPKSSWALADPLGSTTAAGGDGAPDAQAGTGVSFGAKGPHGTVLTAAQLDGTADAYLNTGKHVVDTDKTFSVGAWVMLPQLPTKSMSVVSQDGSAQSGFSLGYDATAQKWSFQAPDSEIDSMVSWQVLGPKPVPGEWTHLVGVYDRDEGGPPGKMRMYINGRLVSGDIQERSTTWNATGALQIGRALEPAGYTANLKGSVAGVQVLDRVLTPDETKSLGGLPPLQLAYWGMEEVDESTGRVPENSGGTSLTLHGGAGVFRPDESCDPLDPACVPQTPLAGDGHLALAGRDGYASRSAGLLKPKASFTVTARARLSSLSGEKDQTVLSLPGRATSAALVRFDADKDRWQLALTAKDAADAAVVESQAPGFLPSTSDNGDHLALSYNALFGEVRLYVNGQWTGEAVKWSGSQWDLDKAGLQVGRSGVGSHGTEFFSGAVDEVRVFEGALDEPLVGAVSLLEPGLDMGGGTVS